MHGTAALHHAPNSPQINPVQIDVAAHVGVAAADVEHEGAVVVIRGEFELHLGPGDGREAIAAGCPPV